MQRLAGRSSIEGHLAELRPDDADPEPGTPGGCTAWRRTDPEFPGVSEFFIREVGDALHLGRGTAAFRARRAFTWRDELPATFALLRRGELDERRASRLAAVLEHTPPEHPNHPTPRPTHHPSEELRTVTSWLLVHPPLLGPAVLRPLAAELRSRGNAVRVPDLRAAVRTAPGWFDRVTEAAAVQGPVDVVLGFSGAGVVLPAIAAAVEAGQVVWLDAVLPAARGATETPPERLAQLACLVRGDRLAPWPTWWPPEVLAEELPDPQLRAAVSAEAPALPAEFYAVAVPVPVTWPQDDVRYAQLSPPYAAEATEARARGWRVAGTGDGSHLDVAARPAAVADLTIAG